MATRITHTTPHALPDSSADQQQISTHSYAEVLDTFTNDQILSGELPKELTEKWAIDVLSNFIIDKKITVVLPRDENWLLSIGFNALLFGDAKITDGCPGIFIVALFLSEKDFWRPGNLSEQARVLIHLYQLDKLLYIPDTYPAKRTILRLIDCVIERIALNKGMQDKPHFSIPVTDANLNAPKKYQHSLFCIKTHDGWRCGDYNSGANQPVQIVQLNVCKTRNLLLDEKKEIIPHAGIILSSKKDTDSIKVSFLFYTPLDPFRRKGNSFTLSANVHPRDKKLKLHNLKQDNLLKNSTENGDNDLSLEQENYYISLVEELYPTFKDRLAKGWEKPVTIPLFLPQSQADTLHIIFGMLLSAAKNPEEHLEELSYLAEQINPTFSEDEVDQMIDNHDAELQADGTLVVGPKALHKKLCDTTIAKLKQAQLQEETGIQPLPPRPTPIKTSNATIVEEIEESPAPSTPEIEKEKEKEYEEICESEEDKQLRLLEKAAEKERRRVEYEFKLGKTKHLAEHSSAPIGHEKPFKLELPPNKDAKVKSIYSGNPLKAKEFKTLAADLLRKKAEQMSATSTKTKGSHIKFHFKSTEGGSSTGMTFVMQHKKKDHHGSLSAQKETLDRIFNL